MSPSDLNNPALACGLLTTFSDAGADAAFATEVRNQAGFWPGNPATVQPYNDCKGANALSFRGGRIVFGHHLFWRTVRDAGAFSPIAGVLAHEWAHQVQYNHGWTVPQGQPVLPIELEADAFAGYYTYLAQGWSAQQLEAFLTTLERIGDTNFTSPNHHGTPAERRALGHYGAWSAEYMMQKGEVYSDVDLHGFFRAEIARVTGARALLAEPPAIPPMPEHWADRHGPPAMPYSERTRFFPRP